MAATQASITQQEQAVVYDKVKKTSILYREYKAGNTPIDISVPTSNNAINSGVDKSIKQIEEFQGSARGKELGEKNTQVLEDLKQVLQNEKLILDAKNDDEQVQKAVKSGYIVAKDIVQNPAIREVLVRWKNELRAAAKAGDWKDTLRAGGDVFAKMREAEAFLELVVELGALMKGLANKQSKEERDKIFQQMGNSLQALSSSTLWRKMLANHSIPNNYKSDAKNALDNIDKQHMNAFIKDAQALLQAIVGPDVDLGPFVRASAAAYDSLALNKTFVTILSDTQALLQDVNNNRIGVDDLSTQQHINGILDQLEFEIALAKNNHEFRVAKEELQKVVAQLKKDPVNKKVYNDIRQLLKDADSDFLGAFRAFLVPILKEHLSSIPVQMLNSSARLMGSQIDFQLANLKLDANDFIPDNFRFKVEYEMEGKGQSFSVEHQKIVIHVDVNNIQLSFEDVMWSYIRHSAPKMEDKGKVRFHTLRNGISLKLVVEIYPKRTEDIFVVKTAECDIDKFSVHFTESKRNTTYNVLFGMFVSRIKKEVKNAVETKLKELGKQAEVKMVSFAKEGKERVNQNVNKVKNNINKRKEEKKQKKEQKKAAKIEREAATAAAAQATTAGAFSTNQTGNSSPIISGNNAAVPVDTIVEVIGAETVITQLSTEKSEDKLITEIHPPVVGGAAM